MSNFFLSFFLSLYPHNFSTAKPCLPHMSVTSFAFIISFISFDLSLKFAARLGEFYLPPVNAFCMPSDGEPQT